MKEQKFFEGVPLSYGKFEIGHPNEVLQNLLVMSGKSHHTRLKIAKIAKIT